MRGAGLVPQKSPAEVHAILHAEDVALMLQQQATQLGGNSAYGQGEYGAGLYGTAADNYVTISPMPGEVWSVDYVETSCTSQSIPQFAVYLNTLDSSGLLGTSIDANLDTVEFPEMRITSGDTIIGVWFGGDVNSTATATAWGGTFNPDE
jgi:membrane peptidoglycan carboxypeptidase